MITLKKIITRPFDRAKVPPRQNPVILFGMWIWSLFTVKGHHLKITKTDMDGLKPPYIVLSNHLSFTDFAVTPLALFPHRANYVSELEGFELYGGLFYRHLGALGTRKFVDDLALIKNIKRVVDRGDIIVIYPEARYTNQGKETIIPDSVGKLCKMLGVPVVILNMKGNYLRMPIWNTKVRKQAKLSAELKQLFRADELKNTPVEDINKAIREALAFDEYRYQFDNKIKINEPWRAEGLEKVLYQCPVCKHEFTTKTEGAELFCKNCGTAWTMDEYGRLISGRQITYVPKWYEWQRRQVIHEIDSGKYHFKGKVHIESLPNEYNFIDLGEGMLEHREDGFYLTFKDFGEKEAKTMFFSSKGLFSLHTEYNYRDKKGMCITLSTLDNTYFLYPRCEGFNPTKLKFAAEYMHEKERQ